MIAVLLSISSCALVGVAICEHLPVSLGPPNEGLTLLLELSLLLDLLIAALTLAAVAYCATLCVARRRPSILAWTLPFLATLAMALFLPEIIRSVAFARLAGRCKDLIASIQSFEESHGRPPSELFELPNLDRSFLSTGMRGYPDIEYSSRGGVWELNVHCSRGMVNFDRFVYNCDGDYSQLHYQGVVQRIDGWAYLWE